MHTLNRPASWPTQKKLVNILCFCLLDNHFHLLLKEVREGGISMFMQKLGSSMARHFNLKYKEKGSLFQGAYRARTIKEDSYLRYVSAYIQVKNTFEVINKGRLDIIKEFDTLYDLASKHLYSSLGSYTSSRLSPIIDKDILGELYTPRDYKIFAKEVMFGRAEFSEETSSDLE